MQNEIKALLYDYLTKNDFVDEVTAADEQGEELKKVVKRYNEKSIKVCLWHTNI